MLIDVLDESGMAVDVDALEAQARFVLQQLKMHPEAELSVVLVDEETMADYHLRYMDEPGPTDVMSWSMDEIRQPGQQDDAEEGHLGDVMICPQVAARQAVDVGHSTVAELEVLLTHGILHLLGHDHEEPEEHAVMFGLQEQLVREWRDRAGDTRS
jgi:probable rRNA maturation factor